MEMWRLPDRPQDRLNRADEAPPGSTGGARIRPLAGAMPAVSAAGAGRLSSLGQVLTIQVCTNLLFHRAVASGESHQFPDGVGERALLFLWAEREPVGS